MLPTNSIGTTQIGFVLILLCVCVYETLAGNDQQEDFYTIEKHNIEETPKALRLLRSFLKQGLKADERCKRYGVLLNQKRDHVLDQFWIAELGLAPINWINNQYTKITREDLRNSYMEAIDEIRQSGHIDLSLLELVDCLERYFKTTDIKAKSFLNNKSLQDIIEQQVSIMGQPLDFLLKDEVKHPDLALNDLQPEVYHTILNIFNGDREHTNSKFQQSPTTEATFAVPPPSPSPASSDDHLAHELIDDAESVHNAESSHPLESPRDEQHHQVVEIPIEVGSINDEGYGETGGDVNVDDDDDDDESYNEEDLDYLNRLQETFYQLYNTLPPETLLNERCRAYDKLMAADSTKLDEQLVNRLAQETKENIRKFGPEGEIFEPDANSRASFLFILKQYNHEHLGNDIWVDLADCLSLWEDNDEEIQEFMSSDYLRVSMDNIIKTAEAQAQDEAAKVIEVIEKQDGSQKSQSLPTTSDTVKQPIVEFPSSPTQGVSPVVQGNTPSSPQSPVSVGTPVSYKSRTPTVGSPVRSPIGSPVRSPIGSPIRSPIGSPGQVVSIPSSPIGAAGLAPIKTSIPTSPK